ncbi:dephospho-CoA kinase [bacterium]|nr:dephospho-CoA kinase [bacterium]
MKKKHALIVGVTGGVGSGKTTVVGFLEERGWLTLDVDELAQSAIQYDIQIKERIKSVFGSEIIGMNGKLNRKKLANIVFSNASILNKFNNIVWPPLIQTLKIRLHDMKKYHSVPTAVDMAVLFESQCQSLFDCILVVTATRKTRERRLKAQRKWTDQEISMRIASQFKESLKIKQADYVIRNNGSIENLKEKTHTFAQWIYELNILSGKE